MGTDSDKAELIQSLTKTLEDIDHMYLLFRAKIQQRSKYPPDLSEGSDVYKSFQELDEKMKAFGQQLDKAQLFGGTKYVVIEKMYKDKFHAYKLNAMYLLLQKFSKDNDIPNLEQTMVKLLDEWSKISDENRNNPNTIKIYENGVEKEITPRQLYRDAHLTIIDKVSDERLQTLYSKEFVDACNKFEELAKVAASNNKASDFTHQLNERYKAVEEQTERLSLASMAAPEVTSRYHKIRETYRVLTDSLKQAQSSESVIPETSVRQPSAWVTVKKSDINTAQKPILHLLTNSINKSLLKLREQHKNIESIFNKIDTLMEDYSTNKTALVTLAEQNHIADKYIALSKQLIDGAAKPAYLNKKNIEQEKQPSTLQPQQRGKQ